MSKAFEKLGAKIRLFNGKINTLRPLVCKIVLLLDALLHYYVLNERLLAYFTFLNKKRKVIRLSSFTLGGCDLHAETIVGSHAI